MTEQIEAVVQKEREIRDAALIRAGELLMRTPDGNYLSAEDFRAFEGNITSAREHDELLQVAERANTWGTLRVTDEPTVYGPKSGNSIFKDLYDVAKSHPSNAAAQRLTRYCQEIDTWTGAEGRRRDLARKENHERRTPMSPAAGFGGELVTPAYILELTSLYRPTLCSYSTLCTPMELPDYGMVVQVPSFSGPVNVANQVANTGVAETDPTTAYLTSGSQPLFNANIELLTGQVTASTQEFERVGPGYTLDQWIMSELSVFLEDAVDSYTLSTVLAAITNSPVDDTVTASITQFWGDVATAKQTIATTAGTRYRPTHLVVPSPVVDWLEMQVDDDHRPIFVPIYDWSAINNQDDGDTGYSVQSLRLFRDDNIPTASHNSDTCFQLLVSRPSTVVLMRGDPMPSVFVETVANSLSVILNLRQYACAIPRYPNATEVITGSTYVDTLAASTP